MNLWLFLEILSKFLKLQELESNSYGKSLPKSIKMMMDGSVSKNIWIGLEDS